MFQVLQRSKLRNRESLLSTDPVNNALFLMLLFYPSTEASLSGPIGSDNCYVAT